MNPFPRFYRMRLKHCIVTALGATWLALASYSAAQITAPNGSQPQDNRTSATGSVQDPPGSGVHEGSGPQSKDAKSTARPGAEQKPEGATGFDNGLYGTGTGSNK
jgi:hypothetical protein